MAVENSTHAFFDMMISSFRKLYQHSAKNGLKTSLLWRKLDRYFWRKIPENGSLVILHIYLSAPSLFCTKILIM